MILFWPVGLAGLETLYDNRMSALPVPRRGELLFLPALEGNYALDMARLWFCCSEGHGEAGFVTAFEIDDDNGSRWEIPTAIGDGEKDLWKQPFEVAELNERLRSPVHIISALYGVRSPGWIPHHGPSKGLDAAAQVQRLNGMLTSNIVDVMREVVDNPKPIYMNYAHWLQHSPEELGIGESDKDVLLGTILEAWRDNFSELPLPNSPEAASFIEADSAEEEPSGYAG